MNWYEKVQRYYSKGYYTDNDMKIFVRGSKITEEEYKQITGLDYVEVDQ